MTGPVTALELAAVLEASGVRDADARERHGAADVFELAERLYDPSGLAAAQAAPARPPSPSLLTAVALCVVFAFPVIAGMAFAPLLGTVAAVLLAAAAFSWGWGQGVSALAQRRLGWGDAAGALALLRVASAVGIALTVVFAAAVAELYPVPRAALLAAALVHAAYVTAAQALVLLGRARLLAAVLLPAELLAAAHLLDDHVSRSAVVEAVVLAAVTASVAAAARVLRAPAPGRLALTRRDVRVGATYAGYGWCVAAVVLLPVVLADVVQELPVVVVPLVLPLVVATGAAEWFLISYRARAAHLAARERTVDGFGRASAVALARHALGHWAILLSGIALAALGLAYAVLLVPSSLLALATYAALGPALFLGLVCVAHGRVRELLGVLAAVVAAQGVAVALAGARGEVPLLGAVALLALTVPIAYSTARDPVAHW